MKTPTHSRNFSGICDPRRPGAKRPGRSGKRRFPPRLVPLTAFLLAAFLAAGARLASAAAWGPPLPRSPLFELARRSDLIVIARPSKGAQVRVVAVIQGDRNLKTLYLPELAKLRRGLTLPAAKDAPAQSAADFREAILFLRRFRGRWRICEMIPRARAANGCIWVRDGKVFWYVRNPWSLGPRLVEREPKDAKPGKAYHEAMTLKELRTRLVGWRRDLAGLRRIDRMTSPLAQMRALRAFVHPSTRPPHSPQARLLARKVYPEVARKMESLWAGKKPKPPKESAWVDVRPGPPASVRSALVQLMSKNAAERVKALRTLRYSAALEVVPAALKGLGDPDEKVRLAAAEALGDYADESCSQTLIARYRKIRNPRDPVRRALLRALATSEDPDAVAELILALQDPTEPFGRDLAELLCWVFRTRPKKGASATIFREASFWLPKFQRRFGRKLALRPWDYARLKSLVKRSPRAIAMLPASELRLIPPETVDEILRDCADRSFPRRATWCELLLNAWSAGALNEKQGREVLETFGRAVLSGRKVYPLGTEAPLRLVADWPRPVRLPRNFKLLAKTQVFVDGQPAGRPYTTRYPSLYIGRVSPADFGPGKHRVYVQTDYSIRAGKSSLATSVKSNDLTFAIVPPTEDFGLQPKTDPQLDAKVEKSFVFTSGTAQQAGTPKERPPERKGGRSRYSFGGGIYEVFCPAGWKVTEPLPIDLAFKVDYELLDFGLILSGGSIYVPSGQTASGYFNPFILQSRLAALKKPGKYRFRAHLTPSRDVALRYVDSKAFWDGYILTSPVMWFRVTFVPYKKK